MRTPTVWLLTVISFTCVPAASAVAQQADAPTREAAIEQEQAEKSTQLHPYTPGKAEELLDRAEGLLANGLKLHPFLQSAYSGGGFTLGLGYAQRVGAYNFLDFRGSYTISNYKRIETEFRAPRIPVWYANAERFSRSSP